MMDDCESMPSWQKRQSHAPLGYLHSIRRRSDLPNAALQMQAEGHLQSSSAAVMAY
jgi:hypothetical protein